MKIMVAGRKVCENGTPEAELFLLPPLCTHFSAAPKADTAPRKGTCARELTRMNAHAMLKSSLSALPSTTLMPRLPPRTQPAPTFDRSSNGRTDTVYFLKHGSREHRCAAEIPEEWNVDRSNDVFGLRATGTNLPCRASVCSLALSGAQKAPPAESDVIGRFGTR